MGINCGVMREGRQRSVLCRGCACMPVHKHLHSHTCRSLDVCPQIQIYACAHQRVHVRLKARQVKLHPRGEGALTSFWFSLTNTQAGKDSLPHNYHLGTPRALPCAADKCRLPQGITQIRTPTHAHTRTYTQTCTQTHVHAHFYHTCTPPVLQARVGCPRASPWSWVAWRTCHICAPCCSM